MSAFLFLAAVYLASDVADQYDTIGPWTSPANDDRYAAIGTACLLGASFVAWCVERIVDAIEGDEE